LKQKTQLLIVYFIMKLNYKKGFTLIELLVVIAIIGILASVVLASLSSARIKGTAAKIQSELSSMRAQAELYYSTNSNYGAYAAKAQCATATATNIFGSAGTGSLKTLVADVLVTDTAATATQCAAGNTGESAGNASSWAVAAQNPANTANFYCVDSSGTSKESAQANGAAAITVDATSARCS
jgi:prepilin-type N-terminal cleavage/methylation domain-containing protein